MNGVEETRSIIDSLASIRRELDDLARVHASLVTKSQTLTREMNGLLGRIHEMGLPPTVQADIVAATQATIALFERLLPVLSKPVFELDRPKDEPPAPPEPPK